MRHPKDGYKNIQKYFNENLVAMLNYSLSYECWTDLPSLMQAWIRTIIPSLFVCYAANRHQRLIMFFELFIVLRSLSVIWTLGFASLCLAQLPNPLRVLSKTQPVAEVMGYWLWVNGYGWWVIGDWLLDMGGKAAYPCLYTLHPTLYTISANAPAFRL